MNPRYKGLVGLVVVVVGVNVLAHFLHWNLTFY